MSRLLSIACSLIGCLLLQACATPGPAFTQLEPVPEGKGHVYLYRQSALYAVAAKYQVRSAEEQVLGDLSNASYLLLPLDPGPQRLKVVEAARWIEKFCEFEVTAGRNHFVEYDSSAGLFLGLGALSRCAERSEADALPALRRLNRAE